MAGDDTGGAEYGRLAREYPSLAAVKFTSSDPATVAELVRNAAPLQCFLTEPAYVLAPPDVERGLLVSLSGVRHGMAELETKNAQLGKTVGQAPARAQDTVERGTLVRRDSGRGHSDDRRGLRSVRAGHLRRNWCECARRLGRRRSLGT